jgi:FKBP-type peptidyl-prolyl cis-trans isomerase
MTKLLSVLAVALATTLSSVDGFSMQMTSSQQSASSRRSFLSKAAGAAVFGGMAMTQIPNNVMAAPTIYQLDSGVKYAITKETTKGSYPQEGDIVAVEYTGYLTDGSIFDGTHSEGKSNALLFKLGSTAVTPGMNKMVAEMKVGQKVQAIIPPELAFGDKGICIEKDGKQECLVKPGSTLVYDIFLKKASIPPP